MGLRGAIMWAAALIAAPLSAKCEIKELAELPIRMSGRQPLITIGVEGRDMSFVLDTGAFYSNISLGKAAELGLKTQTFSGMWIEGVGGAQTVRSARVATITIAGVPIRNVEFMITGSEVGHTGLIGLNFLSPFDSEYDFGMGAFRLFRSKGCGGTLMAYWAGDRAASVVDIVDSPNNHFVVPIELNGKKMRALLDTGAESTILTRAAAARLGLTEGSAQMAAGEMAMGIGRREIRTWDARFDTLRIGNEEVRKIRLAVGDFESSYFDLLIGIDFFLSHRVYVSPSLRRVFFTYEGGPVFGGRRAAPLAEPTVARAIPLGDDPVDAEGFAQRGRMRAARGDMAGGLEDLGRAIERAPDNVVYRMDRASLAAQVGRHEEASSDLDHVIRLQPEHGEALVSRAVTRLAGKKPDRAAARHDTDRAARLLPEASDRRLELAGIYDNLDAFSEAITQYGLWLRFHPQDRRQADALNGRCWARARAGHALDLALVDCNAALRLRPGNPAYLDSRGLVRLRQGDFARAIEDYDAALSKEPKLVWSLYGRGLAKVRLNRKAEGEADLAAARAIQPDIAEVAERHGVRP